MEEAMRAYSHGQRKGEALMDRAKIESLLNDVREGRIEVNDALDRLQHLPFEDIGFAKLDHYSG